MGDEKKQSISEFLREFRENVDVPDSVSDSELMKKLMSNPKVRAKIQDTVQLSQPRGEHHAPFGSFGSELLTGIGETASEMGKSIGHSMNPMNWGKPQTAPSEDPNLAAVKSFLGNPDAIGKSMDQGNYGRAIGRAIIPAVGLGLTATEGVTGVSSKVSALRGADAFDEMSTMGKGLKVSDAALDAARVETAAHEAFLGEKMDVIKDAMKNEWVDVKDLRKAIAKPAKMIEDVERSPGMTIKDVSAAKDVIEDLKGRLEGGKGMMSWPEAQKFAKELGNAAAKTKGASRLRDYLYSMKSSMEDTLEKPATRAGYGDAYKIWRKNERGLHNMQRAYGKLYDQTSPAQGRAAATKGPGVGIPRTGIKVGGRGVAKAGKRGFKTWDRAIKHFGEQMGMPKDYKPPVQGTPAPVPGKQNPPTPPQQPPQPPSQTPPSAPPTAPPVAGGGGQASFMDAFNKAVEAAFKKSNFNPSQQF